jgi:hypothetical protein
LIPRLKAAAAAKAKRTGRRAERNEEWRKDEGPGSSFDRMVLLQVEVERSVVS